MDELAEADFEAQVKQAGAFREKGGVMLYSAYRKAVGGIAYNGEEIPEWDGMRWRAKWGWINAYDEAVEALVG